MIWLTLRTSLRCWRLAQYSEPSFWGPSQAYKRTSQQGDSQLPMFTR